MTETKLPFDGLRAFDKSSQKYIPFNSHTDAMLASLMLAYRLASPVLSVVLAIVRHPQFNPAEITLQKPDDIWAKVTEHEDKMKTVALATRTAGFRFNLPQSVLEEIVDLFEAERERKLHTQRDMHEPELESINTAVLDRDLRSMSLVCRAWTQPAQRALGRILILTNIRIDHLQNALNGTLFGRWTREVIVFRCRRFLDNETREYMQRYGKDVWELIARLLMRVPNVRLLCLNTDIFEYPQSRMADGLTRLPALRELRLVQIGDISQILGLVLKKIGDMQSLQHLSLQYSGLGSAYSAAVPFSDLEKCTPPTSALQKLSLKIGSPSDMSLNYIKWLCTPRGEHYKLKCLSVDLSSCFSNEAGCIRAMEPAFESLEELSILASGLSEGALSGIFTKCVSLKRAIISVRHFLVPTCFDCLPRTLEEVHFDYSYEESTAEWEEWDQNLCNFLAGRYCPQMRKVSARVPFYDPVSQEKYGHKFVPNFIDRFPKSRAYAQEVGFELDLSVASQFEYQHSTHITHSFI
ncbi:hypothetical protein SCHPADRAFT_899160 [Schizopora paradoxa]|uniref:Uncharacterized protein n=1 Tax=Schizopora paradoxa TaxID=27342 RepID=A0A0H2S550_9AGAM|nr:hypothetical protein SCHPADRAFT_899160 [Schizopora paradoxa]